MCRDDLVTSFHGDANSNEIRKHNRAILLYLCGITVACNYDVMIHANTAIEESSAPADADPAHRESPI